MRVREVMSDPPIAVTPATSLSEAAAVMARRDVGCLLVQAEGRLAGILTDRDIVTRSAARGADPTKTRVDAIMSRDPVGISPEAEVEEALRLMRLRHLRRLPVLEAGRLVGLVTLTDLAESSIDAEEFESTVSLVNEPGSPEEGGRPGSRRAPSR